MPEGVKQPSVRGLVVHQDARYTRNRELRIEVNHSCIKIRNTHKIMNYILRLIIRATSCTLREGKYYASVWFL